MLIQGHRGARGLKPENTLPSFEVALDAGVWSIETDVHLTRDGVPILCHDDRISASLCSLTHAGLAPPAESRPCISDLTLAEVRAYRADRNPDPARFPKQDASATPLAALFAQEQALDPFGIPTLADLLAFVAAYGRELGRKASKTPRQQAAADRLVFDIELKRVPFYPERIGDDFHGEGPGLLERRVVEEVRHAGVTERVLVRSFDHRAVKAVGALCPELQTGILVAGTAMLNPGLLARQAGASYYCPDYEFLDELQVRLARAEGIKVLPWTVNDRASWNRLAAWGVDGITTDYPQALPDNAPRTS